MQATAMGAPTLQRDGGALRSLHRNWRGSVAGATFASSGSADNATVWPAVNDVWYAPDARQSAPEPNKWMGSLVTDGRDATGTLYRRNRYYDPVSGRFTQEDPIGMAGGVNLYGYGEGDPVNNSDPFGLCPGCAATAGNMLANLSLRAVDAHNEASIVRLDESVRSSARLLVNLSLAAGAPVRVTQGFRTFEEQDALYARGRTAPGNIVTRARGGQSYHNFGLAIDIAPIIDGRVDPRQAPSSKTVAIGVALGWEWGGTWKSLQDRPHFEKTGGRPLEQLNARRR